MFVKVIKQYFGDILLIGIALYSICASAYAFGCIKTMNMYEP